jgi:hypothetical protein
MGDHVAWRSAFLRSSGKYIPDFSLQVHLGMESIHEWWKGRLRSGGLRLLNARPTAVHYTTKIAPSPIPPLGRPESKLLAAFTTLLIVGLAAACTAIARTIANRAHACWFM